MVHIVITPIRYCDSLLLVLNEWIDLTYAVKIGILLCIVVQKLLFCIGRQVNKNTWPRRRPD